MKIGCDEHGSLVLTEVFDSIILETAEGNKVAICMRDNTFELTVAGSDKWYRADMDDGEIKRLNAYIGEPPE